MVVITGTEKKWDVSLFFFSSLFFQKNMIDFALTLCFSLNQSVCVGIRRRSEQLVSWSKVVRSASLLAPELLVVEVEPSPVSFLRSGKYSLRI